jgi:predicted DNA-binding transcriptional regulator YafY
VYHPTTRVLTVLELLQTHGRISGAELAARLEVSQRSVRRYVTMLQDLGIPVESERGRYGGYRLRPGYKLPPLMFTNSEALAVTLGLLAAERLGLAISEPAIEGALAKIERVLPDAVRDEVNSVQQALVLDEVRPSESTARESVVRIGQAVRQSRRVWIRHDGPAGETTRAVDPYGLVHRHGLWYMVGWCHLRKDIRIFRLDRVSEIRLLSSNFARPDGFRPREFVLQALTDRFEQHEVEVFISTTLDEARALIPMVMASLEEVPGGVMMTCNTGSLDWLAGQLANLPWKAEVRRPPELLDALRRLSERVDRLIEQARV